MHAWDLSSADQMAWWFQPEIKNHACPGILWLATIPDSFLYGIQVDLSMGFRLSLYIICPVRLWHSCDKWCMHCMFMSTTFLRQHISNIISWELILLCYKMLYATGIVYPERILNNLKLLTIWISMLVCKQRDTPQSWPARLSQY